MWRFALSFLQVPKYMKYGLAVALLVVVFVAGLWVKGKFEEAEQADILRQQIAAQVKRQDDINAASHRLEAELAKARKRSDNINRKWSVIRAENPFNCVLDDSRIGLLRDATSPAGKAGR